MICKKKELVELVILSFKYENIFNEGYIRYREWSKKINNVIGIYEYNVTRAIFSEILKKDIFKKEKTGRNIRYLFNPYNKNYKELYENYDGVVTYD